MNVSAFWSRVKLLLKQNRLTQYDAAKACRRSLGTFKGWLAKNICPPLDDAYDIARLLGVSLDYLITGKETKKESNTKTKTEVIFMLKKAGRKLQKII